MKSAQASSENRESNSSLPIRSLASSFRNGMTRLYVGKHVLSNEKSIASIYFQEVAVAEVAIFRITYVRTRVRTDIRTCVGAFVVTCVDVAQGTCDRHLRRALAKGTCDGQL